MVGKGLVLSTGDEYFWRIAWPNLCRQYPNQTGNHYSQQFMNKSCPGKRTQNPWIKTNQCTKTKCVMWGASDVPSSLSREQAALGAQLRELRGVVLRLRLADGPHVPALCFPLLFRRVPVGRLLFCAYIIIEIVKLNWQNISLSIFQLNMIAHLEMYFICTAMF